MLYVDQNKCEECHEYEHARISVEQCERRGFHNNCWKCSNNHVMIIPDKISTNHWEQSRAGVLQLEILIVEWTLINAKQTCPITLRIQYGTSYQIWILEKNHRPFARTTNLKKKCFHKISSINLLSWYNFVAFLFYFTTNENSIQHW